MPSTPLHVMIGNWLAEGRQYEQAQQHFRKAMEMAPELSEPVTALGLVLFLISGVVRFTAIRTLGKFWSLHLEIREGHQLIRGGIYQYVRHPAYAAIMLEVISIPLVGNAYSALLVAVGLYIPLLLIRWRREEVEMVAKFGRQYETYRHAVPAFIPWRGRVKQDARSQ